MAHAPLGRQVAVLLALQAGPQGDQGPLQVGAVLVALVAPVEQGLAALG